MPEKITNIANTSINTIYVVGGIFTFISLLGTVVSSYAWFVIRTLQKKIDEIKSSLKKDDDRIDVHGERLASIETDLKNLRDEVNYIHSHYSYDKRKNK